MSGEQMKDLIQEGRKIQETFKKNVTETSSQIPMFEPENEIALRGKKCPICENGTIDEINIYEELACKKCDAPYPSWGVEKVWNDLVSTMKKMPKPPTSVSKDIDSWDRNYWNRYKVFDKDFKEKLRSK
jgi:hypothetical protein